MTRGKANPLHTKLPARLRRCRKSRKLSGSALSTAAGVGRHAVLQIEAGTRVPRLPMLERLADALQVSSGWLAFGIPGDWEAAAELRCAGLERRFSEARQALGLSNKDLGRRSETSPAEVRLIERGGMPTLGTIEKLSQALYVSPAWLAYGLGPRELLRRPSKLPGQSAGKIPHPDNQQGEPRLVG
jgi:transcriptional regulator with XRE-family HTH domain